MSSRHANGHELPLNATSTPLADILELLAPHRASHRPSALFEWTLDECLSRSRHRHAEVPDDVQDAISKAADVIINALLEGPVGHDLLGEFYMLIRSRCKDPAFGQSFTLTPLSERMASLQAPDSLPTHGGGMLRLIEPACGSGAMLLAMLNVVTEQHGINALRHLSLTAIDPDPLCAKMAGVQLLFYTLQVKAPIGEIQVYQSQSPGDEHNLRLIVRAGMRPRAAKRRISMASRRRNQRDKSKH